MSKLAFVIARDQGLYEKYGLDIEFQMGVPEFEGGKEPHAPFWTRVWRRLGLEKYPETDIRVTGHTPTMYNQTNFPTAPKRIALVSTDCAVRYYVVVRPGIETMEDIKGKRIGISSPHTTSAFAAFRLVERMGWDRQFDVSIMEKGRGIENLKNGRVDVIVGGDETYEEAQREGFKILEDTRIWDDSLAGNSATVEVGWLEEGNNREAARRFLQALLEGLAIFHQQPELALDVAVRWYGIPDLETAKGRYDRADYVPRKPFPCYEGIVNSMRIHDSHEMRQYEAEDFYDDSLLRELDASGFIDELYSK
jgi:NitT/TauT family transport system substrate-binding protein